MLRKTRPLEAFTVVGALLAAALVPGGAATAAPGDPEGGTYSQTFTPTDGATSFAIPENAINVRLTVAGGQGGKGSASMTANGGAGGVVTADLSDNYSGSTLHLLVGGWGFFNPGGGSYVALDDSFLVIAGGGGRSGYAGQTTNSLDGGDGGFANGTPDGGDGAQLPGGSQSGLGAVGGVPGTNGYLPNGQPAANTGTVATVVDGLITPGRGSAVNGFAGGGGYAGGGGSANGVVPGVGIVRGASGGGSGYMRPGLTLESTSRNETPPGSSAGAAGYITIEWTEPAESPADPDVPVDPPVTPETPVLPIGPSAPGRDTDEPVFPVVAG